MHPPEHSGSMEQLYQLINNCFTSLTIVDKCNNKEKTPNSFIVFFLYFSRRSITVKRHNLMKRFRKESDRSAMGRNGTWHELRIYNYNWHLSVIYIFVTLFNKIGAWIFINWIIWKIELLKFLCYYIVKKGIYFTQL